jgi:hypothetical protein
LHLTDPSDPLRELLATKIIEAAKAGVRDQWLICRVAIAKVSAADLDGEARKKKLNFRWRGQDWIS